MSLSDFEVIKQLGKGAFGSVSLVRRKKDSQTYAMKRIRLIPLSEKEREISLNEIRIIASLSHQNIISYKESFLDESSKTLNIVMEYADGGDIETKIKENKQKNLYFSENTIWFWLMQILEALLYLHQKKIIHRDIKGANIFLTKNNIVKIGDLGVSKVAKVGFAQTQTGTPYYCAPEIWRDKPYTDKCDVWSIGCLLYEICALRPPFRGTSLKDLCANVERGYYIDIPNIYSQDLRDVIKRMLVVNERERPSIEDLMNWDTLRKRRSYNPGNDNGKGNNSLIQTIRMPRNMRDVNMKLPKARYGEKEMMEGADCNQGKKNQVFIGNNNINNNGNIEEKKEAKQINKYE
jgi:NIMA (never in mitosis gene a)-related kinase